MQSLEAERRWQQELAARALGMDPGMPRQLAGEMRGGGLEADLLALPMVAMEPLQNEDGTFIFMVDFDEIDSPDAPIG